MQLFYHSDLSNPIITLSVEESEHCIKALRHRIGDIVQITDGKGTLANCSIIIDNPRACMLDIINLEKQCEKRNLQFHLAIAPTKNLDRMEWLVEKTVEIGIEYISFIICEHSERPRINLDRLQRIATSALKQSCTTWLPIMEIIDYKDFIDKSNQITADKYIAWCDDHNTQQLSSMTPFHANIILLVGPEGDFSPKEIEFARAAGYSEVKLGNRRLRTETAGLYGCTVAAIHENQLKHL